ncbi:hypothetical protein [Flagellimonas algicola]|uniref:Uncharacterized protein n=1 Tax=Flagellimonas algicola TaxID=2583815 RepID=A0ABY2WFU6_9FLAO|nr:hypothetical protein [Allomuricauda algicola]TMU50425.1 hypothetical protein FGG15_19575 [Allomuricauda algicola]
MKPFITVILLLISTFCFSQDNWKMIYENDAEGVAVQGELTELISAIQNGENIKIYFRMERKSLPDIYVEHTAMVKFTTIMNSPKGKSVTGQIDPIIGQVPDYENEQALLKENLEWALSVSSSGNNDTMTRNVITGEIVDHRVVRWGTKWYVEKK